MTAGTPTPTPASRIRTPEPATVTAYVHRDAAAGWMDLDGSLSPPAGPRSLLAQLRRAHRRLPPEIEVVVVDLTGLDEVTIELAVLLCLESRMLSVRDIELAVVLRQRSDIAPGVRLMLERMRIWHVPDDQLDELDQAASAARLGHGGWAPVAPGPPRGSSPLS